MFRKLRVKQLVHKLRASRPTTREDAAFKLWAIGASGALEPLVDALGDSESGVRLFVARALGDLGHSCAISPLLQAHREETDSFTRMWIALQLIRLSELSIIEDLYDDIRAVDEHGTYDWDDYSVIVGEICEAGAEVIPPTITALRSSNGTVRWIAIQVLGELRALKAVSVLRRIACDESEEETIREYANSALEGILAFEQNSAA